MRRLARSFSGQDIFSQLAKTSYMFPFKIAKASYIFSKWSTQDIHYRSKIYVTDYSYTLKITDILSKQPIQDFSNCQFMIYFKLYFHAAFSEPSTSNSRLVRRRCSGSCFFFVKESHNYFKKKSFDILRDEYKQKIKYSRFIWKTKTGSAFLCIIQKLMTWFCSVLWKRHS